MTHSKALIAFVVDDRISRDKVGVLTEAVKTLRRCFEVELIKGHEITESELIERVEKRTYHLILAPLHKYEEWSKLDGAFGINRISGPTFAGYFCEPTPFFDRLQPTSHHRRIVFDFAHLTPPELLVLVRSLTEEDSRSGLKPLLEPNSTLYCESWYGGQGQGSRIDHVLSLYEVSRSPWLKRSSAIRIILSALWSLVYEEPGHASGTDQEPKAYFQIGADPQCLAFRLCLDYTPHLKPSEAIQKFWPDKTSSTKAPQLLLKYSDMVRVHTIADTSTVEVVIALFKSAPAEDHPDESHTLWIEPISKRLLHELPFEAPGPQAPHLRALPTVSLTHPKPRALESISDPSQPGKNPVILAATAKIKELKGKLDEQNETIRELRSGGVGTAQAMPPPDAEALLEAFQQRYFEAKYEIRQFELQIEDMKQRGASPQKIETLSLKMEALANRERAWIKKLVSTLETYRDSSKRSSKRSKDNR